MGPLCAGETAGSPPNTSSGEGGEHKWPIPPRLCLPIPEPTELKSGPLVKQPKGVGSWGRPFQEPAYSELTPHFEIAHLFYLGA